MKSKKLEKKLSQLKKNDSTLEIIKESELSSIHGGDCPNLQTCTDYVNCDTKYSDGGKDTGLIIKV